MERAEIIESVCGLITRGDEPGAKSTLAAEYPLASASTPRSTWSMARLVQVFVQDGFTDRYAGNRLVFPGTLRALAILLGGAFPYHRNWKQSETHPAFWELYPTIDHVIPVARGGADDESNIVTTSMLRNAAKGNWLLEELNWPSSRAPLVPGWDGLVGWFLATYDSRPELQASPSLRQWYKAAVDANAAYPGCCTG